MAGATSTLSISNNASTVANSSCFRRTVCLYDWWLIKAESDFKGKWLAVSGITSEKAKAIRVFVSAPVTRRYDTCSLDTADGIYIIIKGFINEQRTLENGFPAEVFNNFIFGFPSHWESFAVDWFRHESATGIDLGSAVPENVSPVDPKVLSDEKSTPTTLKSPEEALAAHKKPFPTEECHASKETPDGVNVALGSGSSRRSMRLRRKVCQQKKPASEVAQNHPEKSSPTTSKSPEEALAAHKKPFPMEECHASKETTGGANVALGSGSSRRSMRLHKNVCQQKKPAYEVAQKHPGIEKHSSSGALENPDGEGLESFMTPIQSQSPRLANTPSNKLIKNSSSAIDPKVLFDGVEKSIETSLKSPEEALGAHKKPFPTEDSHASYETMGGDNFALGSGSNRRSMRLHNIKVCQLKKPASEVAWKHTGKEQHSSAGALENPDGEGLESLVTAVQSQSPGQVNTPSNKLIKNSSSAIVPKVLFDEKSIATSSKSPEVAFEAHKKPFPTEECHASKETSDRVNVAPGSGSNRCSTRLHNIKVCQQKKPASEVAQKHPGKEQHSSSRALENPDGEGLKGPMTPIQSQSPSQANTQPRKLLKNSASRVSRPFSARDEGCSKKQKVTVETKVITPKRKRARSASAVKHPQETDVDPLIKGGKEKISSVSSLSSSFRKSRSGRLLLPPLEFWRNQIAIYNADHEVTDIQEGASMVSPFKGFLPSLSWFNNQKRAA